MMKINIIVILFLIPCLLSQIASKEISEQEAKDALNFWTKERMENAKPIGLEINEEKKLYSLQYFSEDERKEALEYWTPERIEKAVPLESILPESFFKNIPKITMPNNEKADTEYVRPETLYQENPCKLFLLIFNRQNNWKSIIQIRW
jgi:hypothetical protein